MLIPSASSALFCLRRKQIDTVAAEDRGDFRQVGWTRRQRAQFVEEGLEVRARHHHPERVARRGTDVLKAMWCVAREMDRRTGRRCEDFAREPDRVLAVNHIDHFVLVLM